ncbi:MAG TPA: DUF4282 domain-containing protein [Polyangiaceae bacterium]|nr:DUF4282 domain-containing protein [Polyangiaceae bacterium]
MDERAEIWIARDPDTQAESRPVSLRKLRKGVQIGRLKPATLVTRVGANEWVTLERLLADAEMILAKGATPPPPSVAPPPPPAPPPSIIVAPEPPAKAAPPPVQTRPPPPAQAQPPSSPTPTPTPTPIPSPSLTPTPSPTLPPTRSQPPPHVLKPDDSSSVTTQWFMEPPPEPGDDEPIFVPQGSLLDLRFERVGSVKLVRLAYVLMLAVLVGAVGASVVRVFGAVASGDHAQIATSIALVPVVVLACAFAGAVGRMMLEVLLMLCRIADRLAALTRVQGLR